MNHETKVMQERAKAPPCVHECRVVVVGAFAWCGPRAGNPHPHHANFVPVAQGLEAMVCVCVCVCLWPGNTWTGSLSVTSFNHGKDRGELFGDSVQRIADGSKAVNGERWEACSRHQM
mgnify:CR=1 FL=1